MSDSQRDAFQMAQSPEQWAAFDEALRGRAREPGWLLVLLPRPAGAEDPSPKYVEAFAEAFALDPFTSRQRLITAAPRVLMRTETEEKAVRWVKWLANLKRDAMAVNEADLAGVAFQEQVAMRSANDSLEFEDAGGTRILFPKSWIAAIVIGAVHEKIGHRREIATLAGNVEVAAPVAHRQEDVYIDIHARTAGVMRLRQSSFRFSAMFPDQTGSSSVLVRQLFAQLKRDAPHALAFENFQEAEGVMGANIQHLSQTSYLTLHLGRPRPSMQAERLQTFLETTAPAFEMYSRLARFQALRPGSDSV